MNAPECLYRSLSVFFLMVFNKQITAHHPVVLPESPRLPVTPPVLLPSHPSLPSLLPEIASTVLTSSRWSWGAISAHRLPPVARGHLPGSLLALVLELPWGEVFALLWTPPGSQSDVSKLDLLPLVLSAHEALVVPLSSPPPRHTFHPSAPHKSCTWSRSLRCHRWRRPGGWRSIPVCPTCLSSPPLWYRCLHTCGLWLSHRSEMREGK